MCASHCAQLLHTILHRTDLIVFPLTLQTAGWIKMPLGTEAGLCPGDFVLDMDPAPPSEKGGTASPIFGMRHVYCGQTAGWIKMPVGTEVGLSPGDIVLRWDGDPAPPSKGGTAPEFSAHLRCGQTARWIKMPLLMEVGLGPGVGLSSPPKTRWRSPSPQFSAHVYCGLTAGCIRIHLVRR